MKHVIINLFVFCAILYQLNNYTTTLVSTKNGRV